MVLARVLLRFLIVAALAVFTRFFLTVVGVPIGRWYYFAAAFAALGLIASGTLIARLPKRSAWLTSGAFTVALIGVVGRPWTSRDRFLIDFQQLKPGMTRDQVSAVMQRYMLGTGIRNMPGLHTIRAGSHTFSNDAGAATLSPEGCAVYRHSNEGLWNADWGTVCYAADRVVSTSFSPD